ncbi:MAG: stage II sporulation protein P [Bacillota bacterium]|jgi:stage II sporulation protein P
MKNKYYWLVLTLSCILVLGLGIGQNMNKQTVSATSLLKYFGVNNENEVGKCFKMVDEQNRVLTMTALPVNVGDEFWTPDNKHYKVVKVKNAIAYTKYLGTENIVWLNEWDNIPAAKGFTGTGKSSSPNAKIGIYHTHSDESYTPSDGTSSIRAKGGIFKVGNVFAEKLKNLGFTVFHDKTPHDPHDAGAYHRSRRTAVKILKKQPTIMFDVHRDAVPAHVYQGKIGGQQITKVKLVVGRQNQNKQANLEFAKTLKAAMDKTHPGLFEGIFLAKGNYNQDLGPRMMLVEVGSDKNKREEAQKGIALFAETVPKALGVYQNQAAQPGVKQIQGPGYNRNKAGSWPALWWLLGIFIIGGGAFLIISTGSVSGSIKKLREFVGSEWKNPFSKRKLK